MTVILDSLLPYLIRLPDSPFELVSVTERQKVSSNQDVVVISGEVLVLDIGTC